jgi:hypothetical protein
MWHEHSLHDYVVAFQTKFGEIFSNEIRVKFFSNEIRFEQNTKKRFNGRKNQKSGKFDPFPNFRCCGKSRERQRAMEKREYRVEEESLRTGGTTHWGSS